MRMLWNSLVGPSMERVTFWPSVSQLLLAENVLMVFLDLVLDLRLGEC
jgi:hypothetical protein